MTEKPDLREDQPRRSGGPAGAGTEEATTAFREEPADLEAPPGPDVPAAPATPVPAIPVPAPPAEPAASAARPPRRPRRVPVIVLLITALHVALLVTYSFVYTTWTGYDEAQHVDMVYGLQHGAGWPAPGEKMIATGVAATSDDFDRGRFQDMFQSGGKRRGSPSFAEIAPTPRDARQSFDELGGPTPVDDGRLSNQMIQHPPLVYAIGAGLLEALPGSENWAYDQQVLVLRLLNILIVAPLPLLAWAAARRFGLRGPLATAAAALPLAIPGFTRVGATFNNDGILILATGALTVVLAGVVRGDLRKRTALWAGVWFGVAMLSKAFAFALPFTIAAAYLVGWLHTRRARASAATASTEPGAEPGTGAAGSGAEPARGEGRVRLPLLPAAIAVGLGLVIGGWWWIRNYLLYDALQPNGWATNPPRREALLLPDSFFTWFWYFVRTMISRFWGGLGMFEPPQLSPVAIVTATVVTTVLCALAVITAARRAPTSAATPTGSGAAAGPGRLARLSAPLVLLAPLAFAYLMVGQRSWAEYERYTRGIAVQGRYLYLGIVGLAVVVVAGLGRLLGARARWAPVIMLVGGLVMQALALLAVCSYYWLPRQVSFTPARIPDVVSAISRWAPFPVGVTITVVAGTALLWIIALALALIPALRHRTPAGTPTG
ncbi:glycosyltransferase family 39 protein [Frankia sp. Mgl5]|uniref:glycosyltransferase family 39 protein n=1 Tax=Frankia sp. Mgl5 TaxID=2933793 RepID=UPI00200F5E65|nr:glycosyltransferase family 39 protein [Frankia sp. Mgl5]MCK9926163.1 glycosyltransferase family 39 protein [Frankia sp. Mgl5]